MPGQHSSIPASAVSDVLQYGAALFTDPKAPEGGWCATGGKVKRFRSPSDLLQNTVWWTNLAFEAYMNLGFNRSPWHLRDDFARINPKTLLLEWGYAESSPDQQCVFLAEIIERIVTISKRFGVKTLAAHMSLEENMANAFFRGGRNDFPTSPTDAEALRQCVQVWSVPPTRRDPSKTLLSFRRPRLSYAHSLLQMGYPAGPFYYMDASKLPEGVSFQEHLRKLNKPYFANISLANPKASYADLIAYGQAGHQSMARSWAAKPEIEALSSCVEVTINGAYIASASITPTIPDAMQAVINQPIANASWTMGIVAENIWRGLTAPMKPQFSKDKIYSYRAAWLRSNDRADMLRSAMKFIDAGYDILGYGSGLLSVRLDATEIPDAIKLAFANGFLPQLGYAADEGPVSLPDGSWKGPAEDEMLATLTLDNARGMLLKIDRIALLPDDQQDTELAKVLESA